MNSNTKILSVLMVVLLAAAPLTAGAEALGERVVFTDPMACEYLDIESVELVRTDEAFLIRVIYRMHAGLSQQQLADLDIISFNWMPDAQSTEFPAHFISGSMGRVDQVPLNGMEIGVQYVDECLWEAIGQMPEVLHLRPYYKFMGQWGDALVLEVKPENVQTIESEEDIPEMIIQQRGAM